MLIGIDASRANRPRKTGVEWYSYHLIQHLKRLPQTADHSWLLYGNTPLTHGLEFGPPAWHETRLSWPPKYLWTQMRLSFEMWRRRPDVLYVPAHVLPRIIPRRSVVVMHDVGFRRMPSLYKPVQRLYHEWSSRDIVKRASRILTVSEFSRQEIIETFGAARDQVEVVYPGINHDRYRRLPAEETASLLARFRLTKPFFVYVGRLERKKNVALIVRAFLSAHPNAELVLAGPPGLGYEEIEDLVRDSPLASAIHVVGYITEEEKVALLSGATALVHPAWYEGFGIPIVEAMACHCPVICSAVASLPEVAGQEHVQWFDPTSTEELAHEMQLALAPEDGRMRRLERAFEWAKQYTWEQAAEQTLRALTEWS